VPARIVPPTEAGLAEAAAELAAGRPVAMPTETGDGLAAVAPDAAAGDPLAALSATGLVDAAGLSAAEQAQVVALARALWPGPLTLVLPRGPAVPDLVTAGLGTVGVRVPRHPVAQALIARAPAPLAAPSANRFGRISPTSAADVLAELGGRIGVILDGGRCELGLESTVLAIGGGGPPRLLRPGATSTEVLTALLGGVALGRDAGGVARAGEAAPAPGMLASHYAPRTPLRLLSGPIEQASPAELAPGEGLVAVLLQAGDADAVAARLAALLGRRPLVVSLSAGGDRDEAARRLFAALRELDGAGARVILAEPCLDESGLGHAIADRLRRAAVGG
jgi:L-threonylcarbamoyladenylate synthase